MYSDAFIERLLKRRGVKVLDRYFMLRDERTRDYSVGYKDRSGQLHFIAFTDVRLASRVVEFLQSRRVRIADSLEDLMSS